MLFKEIAKYQCSTNKSALASMFLESGMVLQLADGTIQACNAVAQKILGLTFEQIQGCSSIHPPWQAIYEDGSPFPGEKHPAMVTLRTGQPCSEVVMGLYKPSGELIWLLINTQPLFTTDRETPYGVISTFTDITQQKCNNKKPKQVETVFMESQARLSLVNRIAREIRAGMSAEGSIAQTVQHLSEYFPDFRVAYATINPQGHLTIIQAIEPAGMPSFTGLEADLTVAPDYISSLRAYEPLVVEDVRCDRRLTNLVETMQAGGTMAILDMPLHHSNQLVGLLSFDSPSVYQWSEHEILTLQEVAGYLEVAIQNASDRQALIQSEERWQLALRGSNDGVWDWNVQTDEVFFSPRWKTMLGYEEQEISNHLDEWAKRVHPDDLGWVMQAIQDHFDRKTPFYITEHRVLCKNGTYKWILDRGQAIWDEAGNVLRMVGSHTDVTERRELEAALKSANQELERRVAERTAQLQQANAALAESEAKLKQQLAEIETIYQSAPIGLNVLDTNLCFVRINERLAEINGFSVEEHIGRSVRELLPDLADTAEQLLRPILETGEPLLNVEIRGETPAQPGVQRIWLEHFLPLKDGDQVVGISTVCEEITEHKRLESERQQAEEALRESEERFRNLADNSPVMIWVSDPTGNCIYSSKSWYDFTGQTEETGLGFGWLDAVHPEDYESARDSFLRANERKEIFRVEYRLRRFDGKYCWALDAAAPWFGVDGQFKGYIGSVIDISDRKQAEVERERMLQREYAAREAAEAANRIKDEFLATLSHELRTPLNPILGWSQLLQTSMLKPEMLQRGLATIERNAKQQVQLIDDLLDVSRIMRGKLSLDFALVALTTPIVAAIETVQLAAQAKAIQLQVLLDHNMGKVMGDAARLQQVVWNLLSNAIKFTPEGGRVTVRLTQVDRNAQIQVSDTGKGIIPEFLPHVFELFRQQDSSITRQFGGLGLGLAIVRQVVEAHGGKVSVESAGEGQGATFTVWLPLAPTSSSGSVSLIQNQTLDLKNLRVLVVDDEKDSLDLVTFILEQEGASITAVSSASDALEKLTQSQFDLLIGDIGMPQMDGYTLIRQVRSLPPQYNREIPAIALTAHASATDRLQALAAGFQSHLAKPINRDLLIFTVATVATKHT
ncbi:MAG: PAS domain S-box protein [Scytonema sp. PMC 1069.18]|nr:PAS domain S-box protein [Scytonema sp. PMC 1069.18]MEC4882956.1 PAS domain S-box protein [Scytonema sp. PMC 1070.18]